MGMKIAIPEVPNKLEEGDVEIKRKGEETEVELMKNFKTEVDEGDNLVFKVAEGVKLHTVSLSWEQNFKLVTNWMRKHMAAYPELRSWFFVKFIDGDENVWYKVEPCGENEKGEKINWVNYKIILYDFGEGNEEDKNNMKKVNRTKRKVVNAPKYDNNFNQIHRIKRGHNYAFGPSNTPKYEKNYNKYVRK